MAKRRAATSCLNFCIAPPNLIRRFVAPELLPRENFFGLQEDLKRAHLFFLKTIKRETSIQICAKRLIPFLPTQVEALEKHGHLHLTEECRNQLLSIA